MRDSAGLLVVAATCLLSCAASAGPQQDTRQPTDAELVEAVLRDRPLVAGDALELLIRRIAEPYSRAIGSIADRPPQQRVRMQEAVREIGAALRLRTVIAGLPAEDRALVERFAQQFPRTARHLFYEDPYEQEAVLKQVPLEPGGGASVLVATLVFELPERVADEAARAAVRLGDEVVARNLCRSLHDVMRLVDDGFFGPQRAELELVVGQAVYRAIRVLGRIRDPRCTAEVIRAAEHFSGRFDPRLLDFSSVFAALGELGDERAVPLLMKYVDRGTVLNVRRTGPEELIVQSAGDAALYGLLKVYRLDPAEFEFVRTPGEYGIVGFADDSVRRAAHARFRRWYQQNAAKPPERRARTIPPASQPPDAEP